MSMFTGVSDKLRQQMMVKGPKWLPCAGTCVKCHAKLGGFKTDKGFLLDACRECGQPVSEVDEKNVFLAVKEY